MIRCHFRRSFLLNLAFLPFLSFYSLNMSIFSVSALTKQSSKLDGNKVVNAKRRMMSRRRADGIRLLRSLAPGQQKTGACVCCAAPSCCPMCSIFLCCDDAKYIAQKRDASKYVFVRENSLEWNEPEIVWKTGSCLGMDPCMYVIQDNPEVVYYDDPMFEEISDQTRWCNETRTCLLGGRGEVVRFTSTCFYGLCYRSAYPCPCVPVCFPRWLFPCARERELYLEDASEGIHAIRNAVRNAREHDTLYQDVDHGDQMWEQSDRKSDADLEPSLGGIIPTSEVIVDPSERNINN